MMDINTIEDLEKVLAEGRYTSIGSYPIFFINKKDEALSYDAIIENLKIIKKAMKNKNDKSWQIIGVDINWESRIYCEYTEELIESAYGYVDD